MQRDVKFKSNRAKLILQLMELRISKEITHEIVKPFELLSVKEIEERCKDISELIESCESEEEVKQVLGIELGGIKMENWTVWMQVNGEDESHFFTIDVEITEEEKNELDNALREGRTLCATETGILVMKRAEASVDFEEFLNEDFKPDREEYDNDEEYEEAMDDYLGKAGDFCIADYYIDDPGDYGRFISNFVGRVYPMVPELYGKSYNFEPEEYSDRSVRYQLCINFNDDGVLIGIDIDDCQGLEREGLRYSDYSPCYPSYAFLEEALEEILAEIESEE